MYVNSKWKKIKLSVVSRGIIKGKSCLVKMIAFYDVLTAGVDEGRSVYVMHLNFSKAFDTVCKRSSWVSSGNIG